MVSGHDFISFRADHIVSYYLPVYMLRGLPGRRTHPTDSYETDSSDFRILDVAT